jgi:hypothetical protein
MRVYHFLPKEWALADIAKRRIKISEIDQLNDPFELWCVSADDKELRAALRGFKDDFGKRFGMICFSEQWSSPLLWSHYAEKHRGMCLGFDVEEQILKPVTYVGERPNFEMPPTLENMKQLLFTKFEDWQYEEELRGWLSLDTREDGHYFYPFDKKVKLCEVIAGPLCDVTEATIREALGDNHDVALIKARLAFRTFRVVRNQWQFSNERI